MRAVRSPSLWGLAILAILANLAASARAEAPGAPALDRTAPAPPAQGPAPDEDMPTAFGVNAPWSWLSGSFGGSLSVAIDHHLAMRANVARYDNGMPLITIAALDGDIPSYGGTITDLGLGWVWYPRRLWSGISYEAGALLRERDTTVRHEERTVATRSSTYAARAMIGWSWPLGRHLFLAIAAGLSVGREAGSETVTPESFGQPPMATTSRIARLQVDAEGYLRFGFLFGR